MALIMFIVLFVLLFLEVPIIYSIGISAVIGVALSGMGSFNLVAHAAANSLNSFPLLAVPFFILAGNIMSTGTMAEKLVNLGKVLLGRVSDIIGNRHIMIFGFTLVSIALICLVPAKIAWMLFWIAGIFGFAYGGITVSHSPLLAELFGLRSHGLIFGVFGISVGWGGAMGPLLTGYLFDVTNSYQMAFLLCAVISLTGILFAALLRTEKS